MNLIDWNRPLVLISIRMADGSSSNVNRIGKCNRWGEVVNIILVETENHSEIYYVDDYGVPASTKRGVDRMYEPPIIKNAPKEPTRIVIGVEFKDGELSFAPKYELDTHSVSGAAFIASTPSFSPSHKIVLYVAEDGRVMSDRVLLLGEEDAGYNQRKFPDEGDDSCQGQECSNPYRK